MTNLDEAVAAALDTYQRQLLANDVPSHRITPTFAEQLIESFLEQLARYANRRELDVHGTFGELYQQWIDRSGRDREPDYNFRLGAQVQTRQDRTATGDKPRHRLWRGFVTALATSPDGQAQCTVRVPGANESLHATAAELEPADSLLPLHTRTAGVVLSAREAESTIIEVAARLKRAADNGLGTDEQALADLAQLTMRLSRWSGSQPDAIMHHLHPRILHVAQSPPRGRPGPAATHRLAATEFPQQRPGPTRSDGEQPARPKPDQPPGLRRHHP